MENSRLIRALNRKPVDRTPVWLMRQAGRYLPEYQQVRAQAGNFNNLLASPELACKVTLQPLKRFPLDAAILFSDILVLPDAMGLGLNFDAKGPSFARPIRCAKDINQLPPINAEQDFPEVMQTIGMLTPQLNGIPLIGFAGSPWTLATYMIEGKSSQTFHHALKLLYEQPQLLHQLLDTLANGVTALLQGQIDAGVNVLQIFDTWGGMLTSAAFEEFSLRYSRQIIERINASHPHIPIILFVRAGGHWATQMASSGCHCLSLDWTVSLSQVRQATHNNIALQGNLNPAILRYSPEAIEVEVARILSDYGQGPGHVFNLGHGVTPDVPPENVAAMVAAVQRLSLNTDRN